MLYHNKITLIYRFLVILLKFSNKTRAFNNVINVRLIFIILCLVNFFLGSDVNLFEMVLIKLFSSAKTSLSLLFCFELPLKFNRTS